MVLAIAFLASVALLSGFLFLTAREARTGSRAFPSFRSSLDAKVASFTHAFDKVDVSATALGFARTLGKRVVHDVAHVSLALVEALQAALHRFVTRLKAREQAGAPRPFVTYVSKVKRVLRVNREERKETGVE